MVALGPPHIHCFSLRPPEPRARPHFPALLSPARGSLPRSGPRPLAPRPGFLWVSAADIWGQAVVRRGAVLCPLMCVEHPWASSTRCCSTFPQMPPDAARCPSSLPLRSQPWGQTTFPVLLPSQPDSLSDVIWFFPPDPASAPAQQHIIST